MKFPKLNLATLSCLCVTMLMLAFGVKSGLSQSQWGWEYEREWGLEWGGQGHGQGYGQGYGPRPNPRPPKGQAQTPPGPRPHPGPDPRPRPRAQNSGGSGRGRGPDGSIVDYPGSDCDRNVFNLTFRISPRAYMTVPQIAQSYGYPAETHQVVSKGFILDVHRIPHGIRDTKNRDNFPVDQAGNTRPVMLLWHGMTGNSASWVFLPEEQALSFQLANAGYDVWMANTRGDRYARKHKKYSPYSREFWFWTFDELAQYDVPKVINYILNVTGEPKLYYAGHSMGGTLILMALAQFPELNHKIRSFYGLAPAAYLEHIRMPLIYIAPLEPILEIIYTMLSWGNVMPPVLGPLINLLGPPVCAPSPVGFGFCAPWTYLIMGPDPCQLNMTEQIGMMAGSGLDTISIRCLRHYIQLVYSKTFRRFDYRSENMKHYGQATPPIYDPSKITAKFAVFSSNGDVLVSVKDTERLLKQMPNVIYSKVMEYPNWNHLAFIAGIDASRLVYKPMMKLMAQHY